MKEEHVQELEDLATRQNRLDVVDIQMKSLGLKIYRFAIMDLKNKGANNPNSSLHDNWQNMLAQMEEDCTAFGLEEEAMKELWDLAEQPLTPVEQEEEEEVGIQESEDPATADSAKYDGIP